MKKNLLPKATALAVIMAFSSQSHLALADDSSLEIDSVQVNGILPDRL